jgi:hypothetical protein
MQRYSVATVYAEVLCGGTRIVIRNFSKGSGRVGTCNCDYCPNNAFVVYTVRVVASIASIASLVFVSIVEQYSTQSLTYPNLHTTFQSAD